MKPKRYCAVRPLSRPSKPNFVETGFGLEAIVENAIRRTEYARLPQKLTAGAYHPALQTLRPQILLELPPF